ncbi:unnamed protein product [Darwinula stevensoni]|uniref:Ubiquitin-like domain-containing protein n=1 Tax=Darwinula stevensoni TaxID=69355 RepID=A0A7R8X319_9CRUS|nr:unnamed protein product [Darwinula stevensoni]CAG0881876.1 unnamed protein product [Darwinula stevensoni]
MVTAGDDLLPQVAAKNTVRELKERIHSEKPHLYLDRQEIRLAKRGKGLDEKKTLEELGILSGTKLFLKDLGPQVGYRTVFLAEYAGPLFIYLIFYMRPSLIYNAELAAKFPVTTTMNIAAGCWCGHYLKRLWESVFVHRFSHATMPIKNLFRNCSYYWGFAAYVAYYVNHPLFTSPAMSQV